MNEIGRVLIYGDMHLSSENYGGHSDYSEECMYCFSQVEQKVEELKITHLIGTGDLTYGNFLSLEFRNRVDDKLAKLKKSVNGNHFIVKGNHDSSTQGMTEYEYYLEKGLFKKSENITIGKLNISMVDFGKELTHDIIKPSDDTLDMVVAHNYFKFTDTRLPNYGKAIELDNFEKWYGINYLVCGHIHKREMFSGLMIKDGYGKEVLVHYPGCPPRPSYRKNHMDLQGYLVYLVVYDNGQVEYNEVDIPLWPLEKSFNLAKIDEKAIKKEEKKERTNITEVVQELASHVRHVGNTEEKIKAIEGVKEEYKEKAIEYIREAREFKGKKRKK